MFFELRQEHRYKRLALKDTTKKRLESLLENVKTEDYGNFKTNQCSWVNKTLGCFGLRPSALASQRETRKWTKRN